MTQTCLISTTPFASAIQACGRACSQPLAFYVTCVCFLLVAVCYVVHERAARKVAEYEQRQVTQATIGAELKKSVLAAARCVAGRLCAEIGRTHVVDQLIEDAKARGKRADAQFDASIRKKVAQVAAMKREAEELEIAGAKGRSEAKKREAEDLECAVESLKRAKSNWDSAAPHGAASP